VDSLAQRLERVDVLVNNAGGAKGLQPVAEADLDDWRWMWETNVIGTLRVTRALLPALIASGNGLIVTVTSIAALEVYDGGAGYTAAKHALVGLTRQLSQDLGPLGITCNAVAPGFVRSNPTTERQWQSYGEDGQARLIAGIHTRRLGTAEDIANAVLFLASEQAGWISGQILSVDGGRS
jgi:3-oxoacyl-[acyl-carrier protein] reductase